MKNIVRTSLCAAIAACATVVIAARTTSPPQAGTPPTDQKTIVVTGCLKEAPSSSMPTPTGTTGVAGPASDAAPAPKYVLTDATTAPADASAAPAATGTAGSTPAASPTQTYRLIANASALTPHLGKKMELSGVLENPSSAAGSEPSTSADANANSPTLRVQSGKIVGASCTP